MLLKKNLTLAITSVLATAAYSSAASAASTFVLKHTASGKYAEVNTSNDQIAMSSSTISGAQEFERIYYNDGIVFRAVNSDYNGKYAVELSGDNRLTMSVSAKADAETFVETSCDDGGLYFVSNTTGLNLKVESDESIGNNSGGTCSNTSNVFEWEEVGNAQDLYYLQSVSSGNFVTVNSSEQLKVSATSTATAQVFEKVPESGGIALKAIGGDSDGLYALEIDGFNYQSLAATSSSNAEIFFEYDCGDDIVYFTSNTTGGNLKLEAGKTLGNDSAGTCGSLDNQFKWVASDGASDDNSSNTPSEDLDSSAAPSDNFDLSTWNLGVPIDRGDGISTTISVSDLNSDYENSDYFYTASDGGMVFKCPIYGPKTSENTSYTRSELREMLRGTDTDIDTKGITENNWVFDSTSIDVQLASGAVNGNMKATLKVDHVTTTGDESEQGRVIIGQIHAPSNEPVRLYYRKLADHSKGSIYFAHEPAEGYGDEIWIEMIGSKSSGASDPADGIELGEVFSYEIDVQNDMLTVTIIRDGKDDLVSEVDMSESGYNQDTMYQYFKAGVYNQNKTGEDDDYVQATFYSLTKSHD